MRATLKSAPGMLNPSGCRAFFALVFAALTFLGHGALFVQADPEPLYYIYHGQQKHLTLDAEHIAVRVSPTPPTRQSAAALPMSLASHGFSESDVVARPDAGWMILNAQNFVSSGNSVTRSTAATASAPPSEALSVHALITSLLNDGDSAVEFVSPVFQDEDGDPIIVTPTILIGFKQDFAVKDRSNLLTSVTEGAQAQKIEFPQPNDERWQIQSRDGFAVLSRANALANTSGVTYAEPDMIATGHANLIPTDPSFTSSWGLRNTGQAGGLAGFDMKATAAWDVTLGSPSVIVLILDVGVQQNHPDINQVVGQDFTSDADSNPDGGPFGVYDNHGTWVAGCVSERINNGLGTAGIAPGVKVASARCYNHAQSDGTFTVQSSWVVDALNWGLAIGARVSNNSNWYSFTSSAIESAYASTRANGMVHFASAGNNGTGSISYPSSIPGVNSVGAADRFGERASFSQYGSGLKYLAPGKEIITTDRTGTAGGASGDYIQVDGTSFASSYAAGVAALIISHEPNLTAADVENLLQSSCADMGQAGYDFENGYGMIDASRALAPRITSILNPPSGQIGTSFSYQITANNAPTSFSATGFPAGLQVNTTTGLISGSPTASGTFQVVVTAYGSVGNATATVQIVIAGPNITSSLSSKTVDSGAAFTYQITATNNPTSYDATNLPPGLQIDTTTGLITGTSNVPGTYQVTLIAHTAMGDATGFLSLTVLPPRITSSIYPPFVHAGDNFSYQITASCEAISFEATGLPQGVGLDPSTGLISGMPITSGPVNGSYTVTYLVRVVVHTSCGDAQATISISVYPPQITSIGLIDSAFLGGDFVYQITSTNNPTSFSATGLPAGLFLDPNTGLVSGVPTLSGTYDITIIAHTPFGDATRSVRVIVSTPPDIPVATFTFAPGLMVADAARGRVYFSVNDVGIVVLDVNTMTVVTTIPESALDMSISPDGSTLLLARSGNIGRIDLNTLTSLPVLPYNYSFQQIRAGLGGRFYFVDTAVGLQQLDPATGATLQFSPDPTGLRAAGCVLQISPDQKTLYVAVGTYSSPSPSTILAKYDISTRTPALLQSTSQQDFVGYSQSFALSHDGKRICLVTNNDAAYRHGGPDYRTPERDANDLTKTYGSLDPGDPLGPSTIAFSADDSLVFQTMKLLPQVDIFDASSCGKVRTITLPLNSRPGGLLVDGTNNYLFVTDGDYSQSIRLRVYAVHPTLPSSPQPPEHSFLNVSTRTFVQTGDNVEIGGFIIQGDQPKKVVLRAVGPSLSAYGLPALTDPVLELHDSTHAVIATNDNWNSHRQDVLSTGLAPKDEHESVIVTTLAPGAYTAILRGLNGATGTALFELYDVDPTNSKVYNISTRANVGTGDNVMIGGFIIGGDQGTKVIVRAIGPSLAQYGVNGALQDPVLELHNGNGALIYQNDDWQSNQQQEISATGLAPQNTHESAIVQTLAPGNYTAIVRGKNNTTGVALVEVYNLETN